MGTDAWVQMHGYRQVHGYTGTDIWVQIHGYRYMGTDTDTDTQVQTDIGTDTWEHSDM
eukprot:gene555-3872_t